ncbi:hypothetical protein [Kaistella jeonii]|uniref:Uncharacterized protein n=1 Tax=Kaistella jeonii TaxID=266749 RepID=A0A0C1D744_9FLAO|nr:hypothetical protein [Kaistella jeonii]KIA89705.1 hypothetical protein OA86_03505 [Kaistella jeonii]SFB88027.1 hypothetical protein SAMN05421876_103194 [Kaistella jeonii]VEI95928.1 Uncharacterised protein [Kaistella jeonii]
MEKDRSQDKYKEITQELKEEKMNWDFEDFLKKTEESEKIIPLVNKTKGGSFPKTFWMAASVIFLLSIGIFFNYETKKSVKEQDNLVQNEILKQKDTFQKESQLAINLTNDSLKIKSDSIISDSASTVDQNETDIMNQILPKRGRIRRDSRPRYAKNSTPTKTASKTENSDYKSNYVIINGQKIESEQEAIDLTKYSFRILSENVSKTVAQTDVLNNFKNDY